MAIILSNSRGGRGGVELNPSSSTKLAKGLSKVQQQRTRPVKHAGKVLLSAHTGTNGLHFRKFSKIASTPQNNFKPFPSFSEDFWALQKTSVGFWRSRHAITCYAMLSRGISRKMTLVICIFFVYQQRIQVTSGMFHGILREKHCMTSIYPTDRPPPRYQVYRWYQRLDLTQRRTLSKNSSAICKKPLEIPLNQVNSFVSYTSS